MVKEVANHTQFVIDRSFSSTHQATGEEYNSRDKAVVPYTPKVSAPTSNGVVNSLSHAVDLANRSITNLNNKKPLLLAGHDLYSCNFNELVRRVKFSHQKEILNKIVEITPEQREKVAQICLNPTLIIDQSMDFFRSEDFPCILLSAFREKAINRYQFSTLLTLHHAYCEFTMEPAESFAFTHMPLFNEDGTPFKPAWDMIKASLSFPDLENQSFFEAPIPYDGIMEKMQNLIRNASPIEASIWCYPVEDGGYDDGVDMINAANTSILTKTDNQRILPSITLRQAFVSAAFNDNGKIINPVLGISSPDDLRQGAVKGMRDFALPFPGMPLPKTADGVDAPTIADFQHHDYYHLMRISTVSQEDIQEYIAIGDALLEQRNRYDAAIKALKSSCGNASNTLIVHPRDELADHFIMQLFGARKTDGSSS